MIIAIISPLKIVFSAHSSLFLQVQDSDCNSISSVLLVVCDFYFFACVYSIQKRDVVIIE
ncbi:hypothetical protein C0030_001980 [Candidatus Liberibacter solanacearum]|uniref:Uncharacterized protein n=1 Tax=Candidatus Liberibacter solanacearum TaxID=556287 RepID=A0A1V2N7S9_9HYPH|nr:hypothetical protein AYO25_03160 [Candidatus Liberibacter solanacearum]RPD37448.1 hypothetical protein C0030_001980 [Candidatus Liberibacter solanacearum]